MGFRHELLREVWAAGGRAQTVRRGLHARIGPIALIAGGWRDRTGAGRRPLIKRAEAIRTPRPDAYQEASEDARSRGAAVEPQILPDPRPLQTDRRSHHGALSLSATRARNGGRAGLRGAGSVTMSRGPPSRATADQFERWPGPARRGPTGATTKLATTVKPLCRVNYLPPQRRLRRGAQCLESLKTTGEGPRSDVFAYGPGTAFRGRGLLVTPGEFAVGAASQLPGAIAGSRRGLDKDAARVIPVDRPRPAQTKPGPWVYLGTRGSDHGAEAGA